MSAAVIVNIVQASDLLLLLFCGWVARSLLTTVSALHVDGPLFLATVTGSFVGAVCLFRAGAYRLISLRSLEHTAEASATPVAGRWRQHDGVPLPDAR